MRATRYSDAEHAALVADPDDDMRATSPAGAGMRFWAALAVAGVAVAGFAGVVGYGYLAYSGRDAQGPVPLVKAESKPDKVRPENPGGLDVPHREVRVLELGQRSGAEAPAQAPQQSRGMERLLPPPETPLPKPQPAPVVVPAPPLTMAAAPVAGGAPATAPTPTAPPADAAPAPIANPPVLLTTPGPMPPPPRPGTAAPATPRVLAAIPAPPSTSQTSPLIPAAGAPGAASVARSAPAAGAGGFRVQIAALRTDEEARQAWSRLQRKHGDVLGAMSATITRVDFPDRGTFFRVQAGPLRDRGAAEETCAKLVRAGTGCMIVPSS
ncbi:MAG: SPOR domain-containing protein [Alphaproteobacteria bacterium]|nr:SPOR domain-containing protein [Alphaproteobacteria bacterium]